MRTVALIAVLVSASATTYAEPAYDLAEVQGALAMQGLDGWLLYSDGGHNAIALDIVKPTPPPELPWFYLIRRQESPVVICHQSELESFGDITGYPYGEVDTLDRQLSDALRGMRTVAMEYEPQTGIASLNRVPASVVTQVGKAGARVVSSAQLVQFTKSLWRRDGRVSHYTAAHHLERIYGEALAFLEGELAAGRLVTELDIEKHIYRRFEVRGIAVDSVIVAAGAHSASPNYRQGAATEKAIEPGDVIRITLAGRAIAAKRAIAAELSWTAYVGKTVPDDVARTFAAAAAARQAVIELLRKRFDKRLPVLGYEADDVARLAVADAGFAADLAHRTGHSLDTSLQGAGANLDSVGERDSRPLVRGSGFTVGPGLYVRDRYGVRTEINVFLGEQGPEVTSPLQSAVSLVPIP